METVGLSPSESLEDFAVRSDLAAALAAGEHAMLTAGDLASAREWFTAAARCALSHENTEGLARAALGLGGLWVHEHRTSVEASRVAAWQRLALERLFSRITFGYSTGQPIGSGGGLRGWYLGPNTRRRGPCSVGV